MGIDTRDWDIEKETHICPTNSDDGFVQIFFSVPKKTAKAARNFKKEHDSSRNPSV